MPGGSSAATRSAGRLRELGQLHAVEGVGGGGGLEAGVRQHGHAAPGREAPVEQRERRHVVLELVEARGHDRARRPGQLLADLVVPHRRGGVRGRGGRALARAPGLVEEDVAPGGRDAADGVQEPLAVAALEALEVHGEDARARVALEVREVVGDRHVHLVAERDRVAQLDHAVEVRDLADQVGARLADARETAPRPLAHRQLVGRDEEGVVAAGQRDDAEAVAAVEQHAAVGRAVALGERRADAPLGLAPALRLAEAAGDQGDGARPPLLDDLLHDLVGPAVGGHRHDREVGRLRQVGERARTPGSPRSRPRFGWIAQIRSRGTPPPSTRLRRMIRPGFRPSAEAPTTTALLGVEQPLQLGDRARRRQGLRPVQPREAVEGDEAAVVRRHHRVHLELGEAEAVRRKEAGPPLRQPGEGHGQPGQALLRESRAAARAEPAGERRVHERPAQRPQRPLRGEAARRHHRPGLLGAQRLEQRLGVEPSHAQDDDRAEGGVVAEGGQHLAPGAGAEAHPLDDERAVETRAGGSGAGRGQHARRPPRAASPARCGTRPRRRRRSCEGGPGRRS